MNNLIVRVFHAKRGGIRKYSHSFLMPDYKQDKRFYDTLNKHLLLQQEQDREYQKHRYYDFAVGNYMYSDRKIMDEVESNQEQL